MTDALFIPHCFMAKKEQLFQQRHTAMNTVEDRSHLLSDGDSVFVEALGIDKNETNSKAVIYEFDKEAIGQMRAIFKCEYFINQFNLLRF